jgi:general secretion pathway protein D
MHGKRFKKSIMSFAIAAASSCFAASLPVASNSAPTTKTASAQIWNLKNADIRAVIQTISILTGKNFIIDPRVHGRVSLVSQKPMTTDELYQAFLSMLQLLQYAAIPAGNVIKIVPSMDANSLSRQLATNTQPGSGDEIVVRVVPINHVSATELVPALRPLMSQSGSVTAYMPSNALILAGTASNIQRIIDVINEMDSANTNQISVVRLQHANAKKVVSIIHSLQTGSVSQGGVTNATLAADEENNSVLISANPANQVIMKNLIHNLDDRSANTDDTRVVPLNYLTAKKLAPILSKVAEGISASDASPAEKATKSDHSTISIQPEENNNAIIIHAPTAMMKSLTRVIRRLDVRPQEVLVEAIIVKVNENLLDKLGIVWGTPGVASDGTASTVVGSPNAFALKLSETGSIGFLPNGNLVALLQMLKEDGSSDVLSTPSVVVLNNQKATIDDGQNLGVANRSYQGVTPTPGATENIIAPYNTIERQDVTLSLDVTPHISPNKMIQMALLQKDDTVASDSNSTQDNPTLNTSKIKTSVLVKSGDVLVLGGLMSNQQEKTTRKLPVLGDLPLLGHLFRYTTHKMEKTNLMVFIRPVIMSKQSAVKQTQNRYNYIRDQQIEMLTDHISKQDHLPVLPNLHTGNAAVLPRPLNTFELPKPTDGGR